MNIYDVIALILLANGGNLSGRTVLQKLVYLSSIFLPQIEEPSFKAHYYGPYSSKLSLALEKMVSYSFLEEVRTPGQMYGGYTYRLTQDGMQLAQRANQEHPDEFTRIQDLVRTCNEFCHLRTAPLSYASKIFYLLSRLPQGERRMTVEDAMQDAEELGWDITREDVEQGVNLLQQLNLVEQTE